MMQQQEFEVCPKCGHSTHPGDMVDYLSRGRMCRKCFSDLRQHEKLGLIKKVMFPEEHAMVVKRKMKELCQNPGCRSCFGRGYTGTNDMGLVVSCGKCVDQSEAYRWFKVYVQDHVDLHEMFEWALIQGPKDGGGK